MSDKNLYDKIEETIKSINSQLNEDFNVGIDDFFEVPYKSRKDAESDFNDHIKPILDGYKIDVTDIPPSLYAYAFYQNDASIIEKYCKGDPVLDPNDPNGKHGWIRYIKQTPKKQEHPYRDLAYMADMEISRCCLLIKKLEITKEYLAAQAKYFDALDHLEDDNYHFGFDLTI